ncbi:putative myelin transcription factor 1-like protein [Heracleum sosnowskyi]|uniref:Myelin transcription factor 1-like protein n=1 Tax=Heracleum sosnowskyi TaxID=360622 RepID=A0AAD8INI0_9APIA|nr:putative myelin transcription factor 1-like protein [Heracleum sosnowskyi]
MCSFIKHSAPCIAAVAVLVTFVSLFCYVVLFFFTCLLLLVSTNIFSTSSNKNRVVNKTVENHKVVVESEVDDNLPKEVEVEVEVKDKVEVVSTMSLLKKQESREEEIGVHEILRSSNLYSDSETIDELSTSTNNSEGASWSSQEFSDGSISDEESLIEIALPSGLYVSPKFKLPNFSAEAIIFKQHGLMEILAEINEENLIEIDLSMGIIKCSRFEIKA